MQSSVVKIGEKHQCNLLEIKNSEGQRNMKKDSREISNHYLK